MKNKQWFKPILLTSILAVSILSIMIYLSNYCHNRSIKVQEINTGIETKSNTSLPEVLEDQHKEYYGEAKIETQKASDNLSKIETKESQEWLMDEKEEVEKSVIETEKIVSNSDREKDKYLTDPVSEGKPKPVEWQDTTISENKILTCTLSVTCKTILNNMNKFNQDKLEVLPPDGIIYKTQIVNFYEGESVFDVLLREMKKNKIHMEFEMTPIYNSNYIEGINNLYEFDCGELSGWMYRVNGWFPNYGCSRYMLKDKDVIEWIYTSDLGRDIGGEIAVGGKE